MKGVPQPPEFHPEGDVWTHTLLMLNGLRWPSLTLAWGVLLHDVGKPPSLRVAGRIRFDGHVEEGQRLAADILHRLRFSNDETHQVLALIGNHMRFVDAPHMKESTLKRFFRLDRFGEHLELHRLDCASSHGDLSTYELVREKLAALPAEQIRPKPLLTGHDLIAAGYQPGPEFGRMLSATEDAQLEGSIRTQDEALAFVRRAFGPPSGRPVGEHHVEHDRDDRENG